MKFKKKQNKNKLMKIKNNKFKWNNKRLITKKIK